MPNAQRMPLPELMQTLDNHRQAAECLRADLSLSPSERSLYSVIRAWFAKFEAEGGRGDEARAREFAGELFASLERNRLPVLTPRLLERVAAAVHALCGVEGRPVAPAELGVLVSLEARALDLAARFLALRGGLRRVGGPGGHAYAPAEVAA